MSDIYQKLATIQKELKAPKNQFNSFGNYKYRSCEDILEAVKPLLGDLVLIIYDTIELIGNRYYVKSEIMLKHPDGSQVVTAAYAREEETKKGMDSSQITGAASSYARKYALNGLFLIDDTKDSDSTNQHGKEEKPSVQGHVEEAKKVFDAEVAMINEGQKATLKELKVTKSKVKAIIGKEIHGLGDLTYDEAEKLIGELYGKTE